MDDDFLCRFVIAAYLVADFSIYQNIVRVHNPNICKRTPIM